jgi:hypothetical protein
MQYRPPFGEGDAAGAHRAGHPAAPRRAFGLPRARLVWASMKYASAEDRLNPVTPEGVTDETLGGYQAVHGRAAAFTGCDGEPYTAAVETDELGGPGGLSSAYFVFVRWAQTGTAVMGHVETADLVTAATPEAARAALEALPLARVREILDETIRRRAADDAPHASEPTDSSE